MSPAKIPCKGCGRNIQCLIQVHSPLFFQMPQCRHNIRPQMIKFSIWSHNGKHKCMQLKVAPASQANKCFFCAFTYATWSASTNDYDSRGAARCELQNGKFSW